MWQQQLRQTSTAAQSDSPPKQHIFQQRLQKLSLPSAADHCEKRRLAPERSFSSTHLKFKGANFLNRLGLRRHHFNFPRFSSNCQQRPQKTTVLPSLLVERRIVIFQQQQQQQTVEYKTSSNRRYVLYHYSIFVQTKFGIKARCESKDCVKFIGSG